MNNSQSNPPSGSEVNSSNKPIGIDPLNLLSEHSGTKHRIHAQAIKQPLMQGDFYFHELTDDFNIHVANVTELQDAHNVVDLSPCISINIVFEGEIHFALNGEPYTLRPHHNLPSCTAMVLPHKEIMTRYLKQGQSVRKINISMGHKWLKKRCTNLDEYNFFAQGDKRFTQWKITAQQKEIAEDLLQLNTEKSLLTLITMEYKTLQLAGLLLGSLLAKTRELAIFQPLSIHTPKTTHQSHFATAEKLKEMVTLGAANKMSLAQLAKTHNLSISTLQRKFKKYHGVTVQEYMRTQRLETAKRALTLEGKSIGEAAYLAGYNHSSNFVTAFKKQFLITPNELLKAHGG